MRGDSEVRDAVDPYPTRDGVLLYLADRGVISPGSPAENVLRVIAALPPARLDAPHVAAELETSRRTLGRTLRSAGLPSPREWVALARTLRAHRVLLKGGSLWDAAKAAGYHDQFTMSRAVHRATGFRPGALRNLSWPRVVNAWITRQRRRGALRMRRLDGTGA